jgi:hypothetical protein
MPAYAATTLSPVAALRIRIRTGRIQRNQPLQVFIRHRIPVRRRPFVDQPRVAGVCFRTLANATGEISGRRFMLVLQAVDPT